MKVFKFGGASISSKNAIDNVANIISSYSNLKLVVVISAIGKTTNALEKITQAFFEGKNEIMISEFNKLKANHDLIVDSLFAENIEKKSSYHRCMDQLSELLQQEPSESFDYDYDQIVSFGELLSTTIISEYLNYKEVNNKWFDARYLIRTDNTFREGKVDWDKTRQKIQKQLGLFLMLDNENIAITQGFIASTVEHSTTTLGREGSDYTAAIIGYALNVKDVTIWKNVSGLLNADPKFYPEAVKLDEISYREAIELSFYGASVIHPKTMQPLKNKLIPLYVKSFINPEDSGSLISSKKINNSIPCYIFKRNQVLISISPKDFSFIAEENLSLIFGLFAHFGIKINLMQNSAISFSVCADNRPENLSSLVDELMTEFTVKYNLNMELITIRNYDQHTIDKLLRNRKVFLEQKNRLTIQMVVSEKEN